MTKEHLTAALAAFTAGLSVLPPQEDGSKTPLAGGWKRYQRVRATEDEIRQWYSNGRTGVGAVMGAVSANTEMFEFEQVPVYRKFMRAAEAADLGELALRIERGYSEETPGGGVHWYYHCSEIAGNTKLARRPDGALWKVLIETRGEGGYAVMAPSSGSVHPSGKPYQRISGGPETIATITPQERRDLWTLARTFDEAPVAEPWQATHDAQAATGSGDGRPGDDYITRTEWAQILQPHGWRPVFERAGVMHWRRPGKDFGISATTNFKGSDLLYVFTTSTVFEAERGYSKFSAYTALNHGGDFAAAARELRRLGYGAERVATIDWSDFDSDEPKEPEQADDAETYATDTSTGEAWRVITARELRHMELPPIEWVLEGRAPRGRYIVVSGESGLGKSWFVLALSLAAAIGQPFLGMKTKPLKTLYIDEENGVNEAKRRLCALADGMGIPADADLSVEFLIDEAIKLDGVPVAQRLVNIIRERNITNIVTDSLIRFFDGNENHSDEVKRFHEVIDAVRRATGVTWWMLQHLNKAGANGGQVSAGDRLRGSGEFKAHADVHLQLRGGDGSGVVVLHVEKLRGGVKPVDVVYRMDGNTMLDEPVTLSALGSSAKDKAADDIALVHAVGVLEEKHELTVGALLDVLLREYAIPNRTAERAIGAGRKSGAIVGRKVGNSVYLTLPPRADD